MNLGRYCSPAGSIRNLLIITMDHYGAVQCICLNLASIVVNHSMPVGGLLLELAQRSCMVQTFLLSVIPMDYAKYNKTSTVAGFEFFMLHGG